MSAKKSIKNFIRDFIRFLIRPIGYTYFRFLITHKYWPNFNPPKTFSEKIIYRKFNVPPETYSKFVDKFHVRIYVEDTIGACHLIPLLNKYTVLSKNDIINLPNEFVIKTSNGGGGENVKVVLDKTKIDLSELLFVFNRYVKVKIGSKIDEPFYDIETPQILIEKLMRHKNGSLPSDYKIHVFQGNNEGDEKIIIQIDSDRFGNHKRSLFSEELERLNFDIQPKYDSINSDYIFPENFKELIILAKSLAKPFKYVRVDMYNIDGKIYFGELTFCHGSGWEPLSSRKADKLLGSYWKEFE